MWFRNTSANTSLFQVEEYPFVLHKQTKCTYSLESIHVVMKVPAIS